MTVIPAGGAVAIRLQGRQAVKLINTFGSQVVDTWYLAANDTTEFVSVEHTRRMLGRLFPREGDRLYSNRRNAMLFLERDTSPSNHDMLLACCDSWLYSFYGCPPGHANCRDNFLDALRRHNVTPRHVPNPLNFWMNVRILENERIELLGPVSRPGDYLVLRALVDGYLVFSACPMDVTPVNGDDRMPKPVSYELVQSDEPGDVPTAFDRR